MTTSPAVGCAICAGPERDAELDRVEVWRDDHPDLPDLELAAVNQLVRELVAR